MAEMIVKNERIGLQFTNTEPNYESVQTEPHIEEIVDVHRLCFMVIDYD